MHRSARGLATDLKVPYRSEGALHAVFNAVQVRRTEQPDSVPFTLLFLLLELPKGGSTPILLSHVYDLQPGGHRSRQHGS